MKLTGLMAAIRRRSDTLTPETPERKLFEARAQDRGRELRRSKTHPARYAVEQVNTDFEAFTFGLMCGQRGTLEFQSLAQVEAPVSPAKKGPTEQ